MTPPSGPMELASNETGSQDIFAEEIEPELAPLTASTNSLTLSAHETARSLAWIPGQDESRHFRDRCEAVTRSFRPVLRALAPDSGRRISAVLHEVQAQVFLLEGELSQTCGTFHAAHKLPLVRTENGSIVPRVAAVAHDYLSSNGYRFSEESFSFYVMEFQQITVLRQGELWMLIAAMKLELLERMAERCRRVLQNPEEFQDVHSPLHSLQEIKQTAWKLVIEPLILFDKVLRQDPAGAYAQMDYETREQYRKEIVTIADRSDRSEIKVAEEALALAKMALTRPSNDPRVIRRESHVGFYLIAEGAPILWQRTGFHPAFPKRVRTFLLRHPDEFYLPGIAALTLAIVWGVVVLLTPPTTSLWMVSLAILAVLIPGSQSAVQIMNYIATLLLPAKTLPKMEYTEGIPDDCVTVVAIPTLLMNEKQVRQLVENMEVRYLGNQDKNIHYILLSDLPDSASHPREDLDTALVNLATDLINGLNEKYADAGAGSFFLLHRHRVYNPRERLWMGWERKRGKLMDLNNFLRGGFDSFPVKIGNLAALANVRFVITLDSDTELPRGAASRMVGTLSHPLNQAIVDPEKMIVISGYGILQPRVGVSVQSSARSRLASIYSGQTGFDIYTHATSDVYQDLYGEGIFVGKGIYEVETLHRVLDRRFPRNALLSHDLVEGAYARAGLVSDIEVIEDYPSHYSAHNRRKHRWLRGDWQIAQWLLPLVPEESGHRVANPLSVVSRWKILDNLRRSLVEPAIFAMLLLGWMSLPGRAADWTIATVVILFLPALVQLGYDLAHSAAFGEKSSLTGAYESWVNATVTNGLMITFLAHQALLSLDAVVRTMVRRLITRQRLLQWETAAEAELAGEKRTMLDVYLNWTPALAAAIFVLVWLVRPGAIWAALPVLALWACSKPISAWMNLPPRAPRKETSDKDRELLRISGLRTWRFFAEFSTEQHHWLILDNVQGEGADFKIAPRVSPTNLGLLLNARQTACHFGYLTVPEFAYQTLQTFATISRLQKHRGHLLNWYDTQTLQPLMPAVVSSVDSGNLVASLWTLRQGCEALLREPLFPATLAEGMGDHLDLLCGLGVLPRKRCAPVEKALRQPDWLQYVLDIPEQALKDIRPGANPSGSDAAWFAQHLDERIHQMTRTAQLYSPWLLPEFSALRSELKTAARNHSDGPALHLLPAYIDMLSAELRTFTDSTTSAAVNKLSRELLELLPAAKTAALRLIDDVRRIGAYAEALADGMDFAFLVNRGRDLLSVAFELDKQKNHPACYDLLASEARTAYFVAIGKDEIPQDSWFQLGRPPLEARGSVGLLSWTGTMFEYLMPAIWMHLYPNTLLERAAEVAVLTQREYASEKGVPWGISESSFAKLDDSGNYSYFAFGVPQLAIHKPEQEGPVIAPYATFLGLDVDSNAALRNLRTMHKKGWMGSYGFYESIDFSSMARDAKGSPEIVRCWMAHHQGMSMLSIANFLADGIVKKWFHSHPRVQATELLLQEKPLARTGVPRPRPIKSRRKAA